MKSKYFSSPTILIITDRTDLDDQLSKQFVGSKKYIGDETVVSIESREKLREELQGRESGGVYLTTIQKFTEDLQLLTDRTNVICISDEAHRSQINLDQKVKITESGVQKTYGFAKYLHDSLPNATYVGFTGTPVDGTIEVFGGVVDAYTMTEAVKDGITVNLVYDGRAAKVMLNQDKVRQIEEYYAQCELEGANEHQVEESQKAVAKMEVIIGDPDRLRAVAEDFIKHYETRVAEGATVAGKAMFVCSNRNIAYDFYKIVKELRPKWTEKKICDDGVVLSEKDKKELKPMEKIKLVMTRNKDDEKDLFDMLGTKEDRKEFDRQFKNPKSNFKIAIVVDMWLTGFDVPELDTIYIDKPIQQHTLIQVEDEENESTDDELLDDFKVKLQSAIANMSPAKFEQFSRALLTKMGVEFTNKGVQVSNDGGIDGYGYHVDADDFRTTRVVIQCKRFNSNPVSEPDINQFLGAMNKYQADYGVFITNSRFTNKAREAAREGTPITLIDGNDLIRLVIKYELYITPVTTYVLDGFYTED